MGAAEALGEGAKENFHHENHFVARAAACDDAWQCSQSGQSRIKGEEGGAVGSEKPLVGRHPGESPRPKERSRRFLRFVCNKHRDLQTLSNGVLLLSPYTCTKKLGAHVPPPP